MGRCREVVRGPGRGVHPSRNQGVQVVYGHSLHPKAGPEMTWVATACHTEMTRQPATLRVAVSFADQFMLGCLPTEAFQADVVGKILTEVQE
jgi:hypothetical protein